MRSAGQRHLESRHRDMVAGHDVPSDLTTLLINSTGTALTPSQQVCLGVLLLAVISIQSENFKAISKVIQVCITNFPLADPGGGFRGLTPPSEFFFCFVSLKIPTDLACWVL